MSKKVSISELVQELARRTVAKSEAERLHKEQLDECVAAVPRNSVYMNSKGVISPGYSDGNGVLCHVQYEGKYSIDEDALEASGDARDKRDYARLMARYGKKSADKDYWQFKISQLGYRVAYAELYGGEEK